MFKVQNYKKNVFLFQVDFTMQGGFGGIMVWALDLDDFGNKCGEGKYPLLTAINDELNNAAAAKGRNCNS